MRANPQPLIVEKSFGFVCLTKAIAFFEANLSLYFTNLTLHDNDDSPFFKLVIFC
jgi:hypothetical protein